MSSDQRWRLRAAHVSNAASWYSSASSRPHPFRPLTRRLEGRGRSIALDPPTVSFKRWSASANP
jgi:hypothetical protein